MTVERTPGTLGPRPASVPRMFLDRVAATPDREAYRFPGPDGGWLTYTWREAGVRVERIAAGLHALGIAAGDRVAVVAGTSVDWILADTGILAAGAVTTSVYPSAPAPDVVHILADAGVRVVVAEDDAQVARLRAHRDALPAILQVVVMRGTPDNEWVIDLSELERRGRDHLDAHPDAVVDAVAALGPEDLATLIYTSGTTGRPKGVRLVHSCWTYEAAAIEDLGLFDLDDVQYLWLPLSHAFGKICTTAHISVGFRTVVDGDVTRLVDNLAEIRPTFMAAAPRIFEKVHNRVIRQVTAAGGARLRVFRWALGVGREVSVLRQAGGEPRGLLAARHRVADRLVLAKVRDRFGGRMRYFISGSAALSQDVAEFFSAMGVLILEGYGLTETSAAIFANRPHAYRFGTVGFPLAEMEMRLDADGEILVRGPAVMRGYHNLPAETAAVLSADGWLRTGDIGAVDSDGFLRITDRKKDLFKTSGGKYVAPQALEIRLKATCPYLSQVVVHGSQRNFCCALLTLDEDETRRWAAQHGLGNLTYEQLTAAPQVHAMLAGYVEQFNATVARWETIKKFAVLPRDLDVESGELTPSLKVKRRLVEERYRDTLDALYAGAVAGV